MDRNDLKEKSIAIILANQHPSGSYIASPNFNPYKFCWLRDGSFIAHAMDRVKYHDSAARFHDWVDIVVKGRKDRVDYMSRAHKENFPVDRGWTLPARYNLDGGDDPSGWPLYQIDGHGTWLWAICEHARYLGDYGILRRYEESIGLCLEYLSELWNSPCVDCWEEWGEEIHTSTLACVYGGLASLVETGVSRAAELAESVKRYVLDRLTLGGRLVKNTGCDGVDASLVWVSVPFGLLEAHDPVMNRTIQSIYGDLVRDYGVKRYRGDTYYGAGSWIVLSAWLGRFEAAKGNLTAAKGFLEWIEKNFDSQGYLPEQVPENLYAPQYLPEWEAKWGRIASPLLWSHASYLELLEDIAAFL
jgi:GH15 family glucan-1,4-alpha-glucosidase